MAHPDAPSTAIDEAALATLLAEHRALRDRHEIQECLRRYCRGVDRHDTGLAQSAYHEDARDDHALYIGSGHGLVVWAEAFHDEHYSAHQHYVTNTTIDLDGDVAHVESYFIFTGVLHGSRETVVGGGRYLDRFERRDGRWAIADRICICEWGWDPQTLAMIDEATVAHGQGPQDPSYARPLRLARADRILAGPGAA